VYLNVCFLETYFEGLYVLGYNAMKTIEDFEPGRAKDMFLTCVQAFIDVDHSLFLSIRF
jgi:hypothetical protein